MTENLKIEVSMVDVEGGVVDTSLATKQELAAAVETKADLIQGKVPVIQLPEFNEISGVSEAINEVETKLRDEMATTMANNNNGLESRIDEKLVLKADLVNGRVPASQSPAFKDVEGAKGALDGLKEALTTKYDQKVKELSEGKADLVDGKIPTSQLPIDGIVTPLEFQLKSRELDTKFSNLEDSVEAEKNAFITQAGNLIAGKANAVDVYDKAVVDNKLGGKVDVLKYIGEIAKKADQTYVDAGLTAVAAGHKAYTTLALAQASQATLPANIIVEVTNDPTISNNGTYQWNGANLTKSTHDPLAQANQYAGELISSQAVISLSGLTSKTLSGSEAANRNIYFSGNLAGDCTVSFPKIKGFWNVRNQALGGVIKLKTTDSTAVSEISLLNGQVITVVSDGINMLEVDAHKAKLISPAFSGTPTTPTPVATYSTQVANVLFTKRVSSGSTYVAVADADTALTVEQTAYKNIVFTGALTADRVITFPDGSAFHTVRNTTSGGFAVILKCAGQVSVNYPTILNDSNVYLVNATGGVMKYVMSPNSGGSGGGGSGTGAEYTIETQSVKVEPMTGLKEITAMSRDGMTLFSNDPYRYLYESKDFGATWTELFNVGNGQVGRIEHLENGELFFTFTDSATTPQTRRAYVTKGYGTTTPTFEEVFSFQRDGVYFAKWSYNFYKNIILLTEYGVKYSPTQTEVPAVWTKTVGANARYVYMSLDYGKTWKTIFDLNSVTDVIGVHMHAACYDPYWQRIWVHHGDGAFGRNGLYYSDDLGDTWTYALRTNNAGVNFGQAVETVVLEECILFGTDSAPNGVTRIGRDQGKHPAVGYYQLEEAYKIPASLDILNYICFGISHAKHMPKAPYIFGFAPENQPAKGTIVATYNGYDFFELWTDSTARSSGNGIINIQGVTIKNEVIATLKDGSGTNKKVTLKV